LLIAFVRMQEREVEQAKAAEEDKLAQEAKLALPAVCLAALRSRL
jgi:hypothetical protein